MFSKSSKRLSNERGASMVEYVLLIALMGIGLSAAVGSARAEIENTFDAATDAIGGGSIELEPPPPPSD